MSGSGERLAKNRKRARIRRERNRLSIESMLVNVNKLESSNDILRKKNEAMIEELANYGVVWGEGDTPTYMASYTENVPCASSSRVLLNRRQQQPNLNYRDYITRIGTDRIGNRVDDNIYSLPIRNTVGPMVRPNSSPDRISSNTNISQQSMNGSLRQRQQHLQSTVAMPSMLREVIQPPALDTIQNIYPLLYNNRLTSRNPYIEGGIRPYLQSNMYQQIYEEQTQAQIIGAQQTTQLSSLQRTLLEESNQNDQTIIPTSLIGISDAAGQFQFMPKRR